MRTPGVFLPELSLEVGKAEPMARNAPKRRLNGFQATGGIRGTLSGYLLIVTRRLDRYLPTMWRASRSLSQTCSISSVSGCKSKCIRIVHTFL